MSDHWIQSAVNPEHKGLLHKELGVKKSKKIPAHLINAALHKPGKLGERARFAKNMMDLAK